MESLHRKVDALTNQQEDLANDVQALQTMVSDVQTQTGNLTNTIIPAIQAEIASLQEQNPELDLSSLDALAGQAASISSNLDSAVASAAALVPAAPASTSAPVAGPAPASS